jgi:hypothetical protein
MTQEADNLTCLERDLRFILSHLQVIEGNFEAADELSRATHHALVILEVVRLDYRPDSGSEEEFEMSAPCGPEVADQADAALLGARTAGRNTELVSGPVV